MRIEAVVFDMDGVLVDTSLLHQAVWREFAESAPWPQIRTYAPTAAGRRSRDVLGEVIGHLLAPEEIDAIVHSLHADFLRRCKGSDLVFPSMRAAVRSLSGRIPLGVATSAPRHVAEAILGDLMSLFDSATTSDECSVGKPDPEVYRRATMSLRVEPSRALAVEDTAIGVSAAAAAGCNAWAFASVHASVAPMAAAGAAVISTSIDLLAELIVGRIAVNDLA